MRMPALSLSLIRPTRHSTAFALLTTGIPLRPLLLASVIGAVLFHATPMTAAELDPDVERLNQLVTDNHYQEAYDLSLQLMKAHEGEPEFDFLYGLSALEIGRPNESVFAFERVIAAYPDQMRVKLEMARAFYLLNNYQSSRDLFNEVLATNPTDNVKANIKVFLDLIEQKENNTTGSFSWYVNANAGTDSNINSATDLGVISTPIGNVTLSASGKSISDNFTELGGGVSYSKPFSKNSGLTVTANLSHHDNTSTNDFDLDVLSGDATYSNLLGDARMSYGVRTQRIDLNSSHFQDSNSAIVAMQRAPGNGWLQVLTGAYTMVRYDTSTNANASLRDVNQALVSGTLGRTMGRFNHAVSVYYGDESAVNPAGANNAQQFYGVAFSEQYQLSYTHIPYFRLTFHHSDNKSTDPIFNVERSDRMMSASLGWTWLMKRNITVTSDLTYTSNDSNIQLYGYDRTKFQTGIRYQF